MKILKTKDYEQMSRVTANILSAQVIMKPRCVLGLATGSTPIGAYRQLIDWYEKGDIDFSEVTSINLDEYKGLSPENDQSYRYFMNTNLFNHINIKKENTYVPDGLETDADRACSRYNQIIADLGGIDLQLLGLGNNGHIGFNEPGAAFEKETHCVDLTQSTINANARFFSSLSEVPKQAYTMGIKTIMQAKKIVVAVSGAGYARVSTNHEDQSTSYEAQEESRSISENVTWGQRKRMADGNVSFAYSRFLGLDKDKETGKIAVNPEQAETVRLIFHLFLEGMTPHSIAAELTSRGIKTPAGKDVWNQQTVRRMLSNEKYKGDALLQKEFTVQRREHLLQQDKMRRLRRLVRLEGLAFHGQVPQGHLPLQPKVQRR